MTSIDLSHLPSTVLVKLVVQERHRLSLKRKP